MNFLTAENKFDDKSNDVLNLKSIDNEIGLQRDSRAFSLIQERNLSFDYPHQSQHHHSINNSSSSKRIVWGEEIPHCFYSANTIQSDYRYIITIDKNPLITIKPIDNKDDENFCDRKLIDKKEIILANDHRILDLKNLRNYFCLSKPHQGSKNRQQNLSNSIAQQYSKSSDGFRYYLALLDQRMPRQTNCGNYYRMRYAVYCGINGSRKSWRSKADTDSILILSTVIAHIGELHLYTKVPDEDQIDSMIRYENISFFLNSNPIARDGLQASERTLLDINFNQIGNHFRRYLKELHSIILPLHRSGGHQSTYLLEQLRYPKLRSDFINRDRNCERFLRTQSLMLARYSKLSRDLQENQRAQALTIEKFDVNPIEGNDGENCSVFVETKSDPSNSWIDCEQFVQNLFQYKKKFSNKSDS